jgi:hypothetical protein
MSNDNFKKSPLHDKKEIIRIMDELEPKHMAEVVELIKSKQQNDKPLDEKLFNLANEFAVAGYGDVAVRLHSIHTNL